MVEVEKAPQIDVATSGMRITSHKVPWDLTLEL
jgi:hypothetical protein